MLNSFVECTDYFEIEKLYRPCSFFDTVNITDGIKLNNGSIFHDGITYAKDQYKYFNYIYSRPNIKNSTSPHIRGCFCHYRICVRSCCAKGYLLNNTCIPSSDPQKIQEFRVNLHFKNHKIKSIDLLQDNKYGLIYKKACNGYLLEPDLEPDDVWSLVAFNMQIKLIFGGNENLVLDDSKFCIGYDTRYAVVAAVCLYATSGNEDIFAIGAGEKLIRYILPYCNELS